MQYRDYDDRRENRYTGRFASDEERDYRPYRSEYEEYERQPRRQSSAYRSDAGASYRRDPYSRESYASSQPRDRRYDSRYQQGAYRSGYGARPAPRQGGYTDTRSAYHQAARRPENAYRPVNRRPATGFAGFMQRYPYVLPLGVVAVALVIAIIVVVNIIGGGSGDAVQNNPAPVTTPIVTQAPAAATQAPAAAPTATATPEPKVMPTMVPSYEVLDGIPNTDRMLGLPESEIVPNSYFDDAVFVGDSVSEKLRYYVTNERKTNPNLLGTAKFLTAASFSSRNALMEVSANSLHPTYQGQKMKLEDVIAAMGAKKVFIMLGMNDVGISGVEDSAQNLMRLLRAIKDKSPDVQIFVQSATPRVKGDKPTTEQLFQYNLQVYEYCKLLTDLDIYFLDVAYVMRDAEGKLIESYCSDLDNMALHFTNEGCRVWVDFLYNHALVAESKSSAANNAAANAAAANAASGNIA